MDYRRLEEGFFWRAVLQVAGRDVVTLKAIQYDREHLDEALLMVRHGMLVLQKGLRRERALRICLMQWQVEERFRARLTFRAVQHGLLLGLKDKCVTMCGRMVVLDANAKNVHRCCVRCRLYSGRKVVCQSCELKEGGATREEIEIAAREEELEAETEAVLPVEVGGAEAALGTAQQATQVEEAVRAKEGATEGQAQGKRKRRRGELEGLQDVLSRGAKDTAANTNINHARSERGARKGHLAGQSREGMGETLSIARQRKPARILLERHEESEDGKTFYFVQW